MSLKEKKMGKWYKQATYKRRNIDDQKHIIKLNFLTNQRNKNSNNNKEIIWGSLGFSVKNPSQSARHLGSILSPGGSHMPWSG